MLNEYLNILALNEYDQTGDEIWYEVLVVDPLKTENEVIFIYFFNFFFQHS